MGLADLIAQRRDLLTAAERRAADVIVRQPELVGFGTVASLAVEAGVGGATIVRLTAKLGLSGFGELQELVQGELSARLHPAVERIRRHQAGDVVGESRTRALDSVAAAFDGLDPAHLRLAVSLIVDPARRVWLIGGDDATGIVAHAADLLGMVRPGVEAVSGSPVGVARRLADLGPHDVVLAVDLRRYDAWLLDVLRRARSSGAAVVALTDGPLSPLVPGSAATLWVSTRAVGPFDSYVGVLAVLEVLVAAVVDVNRQAVTSRLDGIEAAWSDGAMLTEE